MKRRLLILLALLVALIGAAQVYAHGDHTDPNEALIEAYPYHIDSFYMNMQLSEDRRAVIREEISVFFEQPRHGIFRYIPDRYTRGPLSPDHDLDIKIVSVTDENGQPRQYEKSSENNNVVLKIGNPNETITGQHTYVITYSARNVIRFYDTHEELFWDINGTGWDTATRLIDTRVNPPAAPDQIACYTGREGSEETDCAISIDKGVVMATSHSILDAGENMSIAMAFPLGTFRQPSFWDQYGAFLFGNIGLIAIIPVTWLAWRYWRRHGKDPKGRGVIVVQFDPPDELSPAEVGTIEDYTAAGKELSATMIDLAIRKYLKIYEVGKKKYELELLKTNLSELRNHEKQLIEGLFDELKVGNKVTMKDLRNKFYKTANEIYDTLYGELIDVKYFLKDPRKVRGVMIGLAIALFALGGFSLSWLGSGGKLGTPIGLALSGLVLLIFARIMPSRTKSGVAAYEHIKGLKTYLEVAEEDRLKTMQGPDSEYIAKGTTPKASIKLYEKLLPYAIVLGVEKQWSKRFESIYTQPPDWYSGNFATFSAVHFADNISTATSNMQNIMTSTPSSSSGSGFSGGGSGGGFGGGGGGSW